MSCKKGTTPPTLSTKGLCEESMLVVTINTKAIVKSLMTQNLITVFVLVTYLNF